MKHKHHIIPRHMGGTDDPSNLIDLTVEEHAEAHRKLYEQYGKEEDRIAWLALCGQMSKKEAIKQGQRIGREKTNAILKERYGEDWKRIMSRRANNRMQEILKEDPGYLSRANTRSFLGKKHTEESKIKIGRTNSKYQTGSGNSQFGTMWITNEIESKKINKHDQIPEGWKKGRIMPKTNIAG